MQHENSPSGTGPAAAGPFIVNRRRFLVTGGGAAAAALLAACGADSGSGSGSSTTSAAGSTTSAGSSTAGSSAASSSAAASSAAGSSAASSSDASSSAPNVPAADLTVWASSAIVTGDDSPLSQAGKDYASAFGGSVTVQGFAANDLVNKITTTLAGGGGPDVVLFDTSSVAQLAAANMLTDITSQFAAIEDEYFPGSVTAGQFQGKQYAVPFDTGNVGLFWNKKLFDKAGISAPPETWDDLLSAAKELTGGGQYGYMLGASGYGSFLYWPWLWQNGGAITNDDATEATFNSPEGMEAWKFYAGLYLTDKVVPPTFLTVTQSWDQFVAPFLQEKCAMMPIGAWGIAPLEKGNPNLEYAVAPLPKKAQAATVLGGNAFGVTSATKNADAAFNFCRWVTSKDEEKVAQGYERIPARLDVKGSDYAKADPARETFVNQADVAQARPAVANWGDIEWGVMADAWDSVIHQQKSPEDALNEAAAAGTAKLKG